MAKMLFRRRSSLARTLSELGITVVIAVAFLVGITTRSSGSPLPWYYGGSTGETIFVAIGDSIQDAIDSALDGWTIELAYGTHYGDNLTTRGKRLRIRGELDDVGGYGVPITTIRPLGYNRIFEIIDGEGRDTVIENLAITGGAAFGISPPYGDTIEAGGGILVDSSSPTIRNCRITRNSADIGGGIGIIGSGAPVIEDCTVEDNSADRGGGIGVFDGSDPIIRRSRISRNNIKIYGEPLSGGGITFESSATPIVQDTVICGNLPSQVVGAFFDDGGVCISEKCDIDCNGNGICDSIELAEGLATDCDDDGVLDVCQFSPTLFSEIYETQLPDCFSSGPVVRLPSFESTSDVLMQFSFTSPKSEQGPCGPERLNIFLQTDQGWDYTLTDVSASNCENRVISVSFAEESWNEIVRNQDAASIFVYRYGCTYSCGSTDCGEANLSVSISTQRRTPSGPDGDGDGLFDCVDPCPEIPFDCDGDPSTIDVGPGQEIADVIDAFPDATRFDLVAGSYAITRTIDPGGRSITIRGAVDDDGNPTTILDGLGERRIASCTADESPEMIFENLVFRNGRGDQVFTSKTDPYFDYIESGGGALYLGRVARPTLRNCHFIGNTGTAGGAVCCDGGSPFFDGCRFERNAVTGYDSRGGAVFARSYGTPRFRDCIFVGNGSTVFESDDDASGGAVYGVRTDLEFVRCEFRTNSTSLASGVPYGTGGAIQFADGQLVADDCIFEGNVARIGAAVHVAVPKSCVSSTTTRATMDGCEFRFNEAERGGGLAVTRSEANDDFPASCNDLHDVDVVMRDGVVEENQGQGVLVAGTPFVDPDRTRLVIETSTIRSNFGYDDGGGVQVSDATLAITSTAIESNFAMFGGGLLVDGEGLVSIDGCTIQENTAIQGGGVLVFGFASATIGDTLVCRNAPNQIVGTYEDLSGNCVGTLCLDSDEDGTLDCEDACPDDPDKTEPGPCGCGISDVDSDLDGTPDCLDGCPTDPDKIDPGSCGCGVADVDSDGDGVSDCIDDCPDWPYQCSPDGQTLIVDPDDPEQRIQDAIDVVITGGVVRLDVGRHELAEPVLLPNRPITLAGVIDGTGMPVSILDGDQTGSTVVVSSGVTPASVIRDLTITGGDAAIGGGLRINGGSPAIVNCLIEFNVATLGAGVYCSAGSMPTFTECRIEGNGGAATDVGGGLYASPSALPELIETTICGNTPDQIFGPFTTDSASCEDSLCDNCLTSCVADLDGNGEVNGADIGLFLIQWGPCTGFCEADFNRDGVVDGGDFGVLLIEFGACQDE